jgi:hypothetical protein
MVSCRDIANTLAHVFHAGAYRTMWNREKLTQVGKKKQQGQMVLPIGEISDMKRIKEMNKCRVRSRYLFYRNSWTKMA